MHIKVQLAQFDINLRKAPMYHECEQRLRAEVGKDYTNREVLLLCTMNVIQQNMMMTQALAARQIPNPIAEPPDQELPDKSPQGE